MLEIRPPQKTAFQAHPDLFTSGSNAISTEAMDLGHTVKATRQTVPAKDFEVSKCFCEDHGFRSEMLVEIQLGPFSFILQACYCANRRI